MKRIPVAMLGFGTIGSGVAKVLIQQRELLRRRCGVDLELRWVVELDPEKVRGAVPPETKITTELTPVLEDKDVQIGLELMGGVKTAGDFILRLLQSGKHVVTSNKAVLAERGQELFEAAHAHDRAIRFEASVAGGIPIIDAISQSLAANRFLSIAGILNGTSNYILSAMHDHGIGYAAALKEAQKMGFAEADPALDVNGSDTAQKLSILARLAFETTSDWRRIAREGIDGIDAADIAFAAELGYVIKLLARAVVEEDRLLMRVGPTLVHEHKPLGQVRGEYNAIEVVGDAVADTFYVGKGAGSLPTASSVVGGILDLAIGRGQATFRALRLWDPDPPGPKFDPEGFLRSRFYLRYTIGDQPGALARIAGILGGRGVSIASVIQHETGEDALDQDVPLIVMTHLADEGAVRVALQETDALEIVRRPTVSFHVAD